MDEAAAETPLHAAGSTRNGLGYQPALDGIRAVAVALVVLFHYPWVFPVFAANPVHGGFLGVDIFFVLSGFLITTLLLEEHRERDAISLRRFYARRALRLLPAFAALWLIAAFMHLQLAPRDVDRPTATGLLGAIAYVGNWVDIYKPRALGILSPTWSLAIEEQFYLLWPLVLIGLLTLRLRIRTIGLITFAAATLAALHRARYWRVHTANVGPAHRLAVWNRVYFGSDTRADALLAGCIAAIALVVLLPRLDARVRRALAAAAVPAAVVVALILWRAVGSLSGWLPAWGFPLFEASVAVVVVGLVVAPTAPLARVLAFPVLAWIGRRSYAIYLFHLVVYKYCDRRHVHLAPPLSLVFQMLVILLAAEVSYRVVEAPMLRRKRRYAAVGMT